MSVFPFAESWERYDNGVASAGTPLRANLLSRYTQMNGNVEIATDGRTGQCLTLGNSSLTKTLPHSSEWVTGFAYRLNTPPPRDLDFYVLQNNGNIMARIVIDGDSTISLRAGNSTVVGVTTRALDETKWYYIEVHISLSGATPIMASIELRINGHVEASGSGSTGVNAIDNLSNDATGNYHIFSGLSGVGLSSSFDDLYIKNTSGYYGDVRIIALFPNGDGATLQWNPSVGGPHYLMVNSHPVDLSTYLYDLTPDDIDTWDWEDCPGFSGTIPAINISMDARKDDEGTKSFKIVVGNTGTEAQSDEFFVSDVSPEYYEFGLETDPGTSAAWTQAGFNAKQFGVKLIS